MDEIVTEDWNKFGYREIEMAKELLSHVKEIDSYGKVTVQFNTSSGCVFLCDENYRVWMMNGENIEEFFSCPYCGHEGFLEDMMHEPKDEECTEFLQSIGAIKKPYTEEIIGSGVGLETENI